MCPRPPGRARVADVLRTLCRLPGAPSRSPPRPVPTLHARSDAAGAVGRALDDSRDVQHAAATLPPRRAAAIPCRRLIPEPHRRRPARLRAPPGGGTRPGRRHLLPTGSTPCLTVSTPAPLRSDQRRHREPRPTEEREAPGPDRSHVTGGETFSDLRRLAASKTCGGCHWSYRSRFK